MLFLENKLYIYIILFYHFIFIFYFKQIDPMLLMIVGFFLPPPSKVPQLLSNLFITIISNNGRVSFSLYVKGVMTFFKFNQFC